MRRINASNNLDVNLAGDNKWYMKFGMQQMLYLALAIFLVLIATFAGISIKAHLERESNREQIIIGVYDLATIAKEYQKKPKSMGGGGGTYAGFEVPISFLNKSYGEYRINTKESSINILAVGKEKGWDSEKQVEVLLRVELDSTALIIRN